MFKTFFMVLVILAGMVVWVALSGGGVAWAKNPLGLNNSGVKVGTRAPEFVFQDAAGKWVALSDFRGQKVFVFSWSTWCRCKEQLPALEAFYNEYQPRGLAVIAVASDSQGFKWVGPYVEKAGATYPVLVDPNNELQRSYNFWATENGFLIDESGIVRMSAIGFDIRKPEQKAELESLIATDFGVSPDPAPRDDQARIKELEASTSANPWELTSRLELAEMYRRQGSLGRAEALLREAVKNHPLSADAHYRLGVVLHDEGNIDGAREEWQTAFSITPTNYIYMRNVQALDDPARFYSEVMEQ